MPNSKLPRHHGNHRHDASLAPFLTADPGDVTHDLGDLVRRAEELEKEDSRAKEKHKEALASIIHKIVAYHILPESYEIADLIQNSTYATNLTLDDGSMDWEPLRLSVLGTSIPPRLRINMFAEVTKKDIKAKNGERNHRHFLFSHLDSVPGVIHQISQPLLPPPSIFQENFFVPEVFSFFVGILSIRISWF